MKKITLASALILLSLISLFGCQTLFKPKSGVSEVEIYKGTEGIYLNFLQNAPPSQIFAPPEGQKSDFTIAVEIENRGAYDVREGYLVLGLEQNYMEADQWQFEGKEATQLGAGYQRAAYQLKGKSKIESIGQKEILTITAKALPLDKQSQTHT